LHSVLGQWASCGVAVGFPARGVIRGLTLLLLLWIGIGGCVTRTEGEAPPEIPRGYVSTLEINWEGKVYGFGPFVGYYFRPEQPKDLSHLAFVCFNERGFYAKDAPANVLLFEGEARLARLPEKEVPIPSDGARIHPVFFSEAPAGWLESRPEPQDEFLHFHSCYDARGHVLVGYWLRHMAKREFLYDMGGRVGPPSPMYHRTHRGVDRGFPRIMEFDEGP